ncbi:MAG TPA: hypothetical protein VJ487_15705 [Alphaproteobacteria bacterium]|nr:hypothetical protein [Alphaproteobacteria bacterium]
MNLPQFQPVADRQALADDRSLGGVTSFAHANHGRFAELDAHDGDADAGVLVLKFTTSGKHSSLRGARRAPKQSRKGVAPRRAAPAYAGVRCARNDGYLRLRRTSESAL